MVSGIGPRATLEDLSIPLVAESEGVGQNIWVCEQQPPPPHSSNSKKHAQDQPWIGLAYKKTYEIILNNPNVTGQAVSGYLANQSDFLAGIDGGGSVGQKPPHPYPSLPPPSNASPPDRPEIKLDPLAYSPVPDNVSSTDYYITLGACFVAPLSRGNMTISSNDTNDRALINPAWMTPCRPHGARTDAQIVDWTASGRMATLTYHPISS